MLYWWKKRLIYQENRTESPEIGPHKYSQPIFDKWAKAIQWKLTTVSSTNGAGTGHLHTKKKMNLETHFIPFTKIKSKWVTDLKIKCDTIKLLEDNVREHLDDPGYGDAFLKHHSHDPLRK